MTKPPIPEDPFGDWTAIPVDTSRDSHFDRILRYAEHPALNWALGPEGPYKTPQPPIVTMRGQLREALLYLLETGFIDIDRDRVDAAEWIPMDRPKSHA